VSKLKAVSAGAAPAASTAEQVLRSSKQEFSDTDALGRLIKLRKPSTWERFELPRILGGDSINPGWQFQAQMLLHVKQIGEDTDVFFRNEREMKAIVEQLGDEGMETVEMLFIEHFMPKAEETAAEIKK
jgi:murein endopeptidase